MASAIACACETLKMDSNAFLMVHNPWTMTMGNAGDLRKEAEVLDQYRDALLAIYRTKFDMGDETLKAMLDAETWIIGEQADFFKLDCEVIPTEEPLRAAAFSKGIPRFLKTPKALKDIIMEKVDEMKKADGAVQEEQPVEETAEETAVQETVVEEPKEESPVEQPEEEFVPKAEADKRVSGMQSAMAKQLDSLKKEYEAKVADFQVQIKAKDEELTKAKAEVTSLVERLEKSQKELSEMTSALKEKADALDALNESVLTPSETTDWRSLKGKAFFDWYAKNKHH